MWSVIDAKYAGEVRASVHCATLAGLLLAAPHVLSGKSDTAVAHVYVNVIPNIAVQAISQPIADIPAVMPTGAFPIAAQFNIAANTDRVEIGCVASALHRAAVPSSTDRIDVKKNMGCSIDAVLANPLNGAAARAQYQQDVTVDIGGFPASPTNLVAFQSYQDARFNMNVSLVVHYDFDRLNMPQGQYGGVVKLVALITQ
ncbi:MAG: hypothetical protein HKO71_02925 [Pseudomonadales bacterium]|nr:hypothetical protein [Gammaproteobacteria bacterium]NNL56680.1 hypothetical protein [Pseudomonadales bacterium]